MAPEAIIRTSGVQREGGSMRFLAGMITALVLLLVAAAAVVARARSTSRR
jgi:hypothetical protein